MLQLVCQTHVETNKQVKLEKRLNQLRLQCKAVEDELKRQKKRTSAMLPEILRKHTTIEARKSVSRKISLQCDRMGRKIFGHRYKYECLFNLLSIVEARTNAIECLCAFFLQIPL